MRGVGQFDDLAADIEIVGDDQVVQRFLGEEIACNGDRLIVRALHRANIDVDPELRRCGPHRGVDEIPERRRVPRIDEPDPDIAAPCREGKHPRENGGP